MSTPLVVYIPVKNDLWFIDKAVRHAVLWADHVIVADQCSTDGSIELYHELEQQYRNLHVIYNRPKMDFTTPDVRNYMLDQVRRLVGNSDLFELHADEIVSARILQQDVKEHLREVLAVHGCVELPWPTLWRHPQRVRDDHSVWSRNTCVFGFRDDGRCRYTTAAFHGSRVPDAVLPRRTLIEDLPVLHYQFINLGADLTKQALYQIFERNHYPEKDAFYYYRLYGNYYNERGLCLRDLEPEHIRGWVEQGIDLLQTHEENSEFCWRDHEVLKNFKRYGVERYTRTLIWTVDWEQKRLRALERGLDEIPESPIHDPRPWRVRLAQWLVVRGHVFPFWEWGFLRRVWQRAKTWIAGVAHGDGGLQTVERRNA